MSQTKRPYEGFFITVEGGDGSGKGTLSTRLVEELKSRGHEVVHTREPGGTPLSEHLRELVLSPDSYAVSKRAEMMLYLTARVQHLEERILPDLQAGKIVLCERFNDSTVAYQACGRNLGMSEVEQICHLVCGGIEPDCTLYLDLDPEIGLQRLKGAKDRLEQEKLQFHKEVRQGYLHLADKHPERILVIDAEPDAQTVFAQALQALEPHLMLKPHG